MSTRPLPAHNTQFHIGAGRAPTKEEREEMADMKTAEEAMSGLFPNPKNAPVSKASKALKQRPRHRCPTCAEWECQCDVDPTPEPPPTPAPVFDPEEDTAFLRRLRAANVLRQAILFPQCNDWGLIDSTNEIAGEAGELANIAKKIKRDLPSLMPHGGPYESHEALVEASRPYYERREQLKRMLEDEIADVLITLDLLCMRENINLEAVTKRKFNEQSAKRNCKIIL